MASAILGGVFVPADIVRHPLGMHLLILPRDAEILSCYTWSGGPSGGRRAFDGKSGFGPFWQQRRGLNRYDGLDIGPRDLELEKTWGADIHASYLVYSTGYTTNAVVYNRAAGWTSGAILGQLVAYERSAVGRWQQTQEYRQSSNTLLEGIFRLKTIVGGLFVGLMATSAWNIAETRRRRQQCNRP